MAWKRYITYIPRETLPVGRNEFLLRRIFQDWKLFRIKAVKQKIFFAWKRSMLVRDDRLRPEDSNQIDADGFLKVAYGKVLEECSCLEDMIKRLDESRHKELMRIEEESTMIDFTLNELGLQSAMINLSNGLGKTHIPFEETQEKIVLM